MMWRASPWDAFVNLAVARCNVGYVFSSCCGEVLCGIPLLILLWRGCPWGGKVLSATKGRQPRKASKTKVIWKVIRVRPQQVFQLLSNKLGVETHLHYWNQTGWTMMWHRLLTLKPQLCCNKCPCVGKHLHRGCSPWKNMHWCTLQFLMCMCTVTHVCATAR